MAIVWMAIVHRSRQRLHGITGRDQVSKTSIFNPPGLGPLDMPGQADTAQLQFISA